MAKITEKRALAAMDQYAKEYATIEEIVAKQNSEIAEINEQYNNLLTGPSKILGDAKEIIETYAKQNKDKLFTEDSKTVKFGVGEISSRTSGGKITYLKGWTMDKVIKKIKDKYKETKDQYLNTKVELDKTAIKKLSEKELKFIGCEVSKETNYSIKLPKVKV